MWSVLLLLLVAGFAALYVTTSGTRARKARGRGRTVTRAGETLAFYDAGAGMIAVLIPSLGRSASDFNELALALNDAGYRTLAIELRGIGGSTGAGFTKKLTLHDYAADVAAIVDSVVPEPEAPVHVIGHAFGNRVARMYATNSPTRVRSVALIAAGGLVPIDPDIRKALTRCFFTFLPSRTHARYVRRAFFADGNPIPDAWLAGWHFRAARTQARATQATPTAEWWEAGTAPILVVQGLSDAIAPAEHTSAVLARDLPDRVTVAEIPNAGHALLPEQPVRVADAVVRYLQAHD